MINMTTSTKQLQSTILKDSNALQLKLVDVELHPPKENEVLIRIEASPINPSDLGVLFGPATLDSATSTGTGMATVLTAPVSPAVMSHFAARLDKPLTVGNEGAGVVVAAGSSLSAQALLGKTVACMGGAMYSQHRVINASLCLPLPEGTSPNEGASCFVNPLTALSMVEKMKMENHKAIVHTAAASNLGQMLNRICISDKIPLVNIVRKKEQVDILKNIGAQYICNTSDDSFIKDLIDAIEATGATIAFDATGGDE
eukprot:GHVN01011290.1.p1 GENE.GHVN01011290.1~~GHVN01011290.1.p1  ORF type:complete len:257 (+),score=57.98 GHVN01011290.1:211-981(+)